MSRIYETVIGLEIHAELSTKSKMFCGCKNAFGAPANTLCCPVCTGMPGALPVLNRQVVEYAIAMGHALHCNVRTITKQDRKNYFYPDLPKGYQISQFDAPLCENGYLEFWLDGGIRRVGIERIHIEEDAGKLVHGEETAGTLIDYNRCGVPLIEIVTRPDLRTADEAKACMEEIANILRYLEISHAKMQEGNMRADVNVSLRPVGQPEYGTRVEMKNVNSFGGVHRAIVYEEGRQAGLLAKGVAVEQQTRRWDDIKGQSFLLRSKEQAQDYRYFADPDLLAFHVAPQTIKRIQEDLPELPLAKMQRYMQSYGLQPYDAQLLTANRERALFFEESAGYKLCKPKALANWLLGDIAKWQNETKKELHQTKLTPLNLARMVAMVERGEISGVAGKIVLQELMVNDADPETIAQQKELRQLNDVTTLEKLVAQVLVANPKAVADYKNGKTNVLGFVVGQCMKESKGQGNPAMLKKLLQNALDKH